MIITTQSSYANTSSFMYNDLFHDLAISYFIILFYILHIMLLGVKEEANGSDTVTVQTISTAAGSHNTLNWLYYI